MQSKVYVLALAVLIAFISANPQPFVSSELTAIANEPQRTVAAEASPVEKLEVRDNFRRALVNAAKKAADKGEITRRDALRIRVASFSPSFLERAEELCVIQMAFSGEAGDVLPMNSDGDIDRTAIDWDGFAAFLERILPLILQLLLSFGIGGGA